MLFASRLTISGGVNIVFLYEQMACHCGIVYMNSPINNSPCDAGSRQSGEKGSGVELLIMRKEQIF